MKDKRTTGTDMAKKFGISGADMAKKIAKAGRMIKAPKFAPPESKARERLFIGGPIDGQRKWVDNSASDVWWPKSDDRSIWDLAKDGQGTQPKPRSLEEDAVKYERVELGQNEIMFHDEGTPLLKKLIEGYKRP